MNARSDFLFARASLIEGLARILDLGGTLTGGAGPPSTSISGAEDAAG